jgi:hypothetical protein
VHSERWLLIIFGAKDLTDSISQPSRWPTFASVVTEAGGLPTFSTNS